MTKKTVFVAVGSTRPPKVNAVSQALLEFGAYLEPQAEFSVLGVEVASGVSHTPLSRVELMDGARGRCQQLQRMASARGEPWAYFVGLEGGLDVVQDHGRRLVFLESWAMVTDRLGREAYGQAGGILLPDVLATKVLDGRIELSAAIDEFAGSNGIRNVQGAWGVLTQNLITRQDAFRIAVIHAFAPFFNAELYSRW